MPYKYIGRTHDFKGKTLWEIVGNLKNFGVGRIVVRNRFQRYAEPSYLKIMKVETLANPEKPSYDDVRKVRVWVEKTFRGVTHPKLIAIERSSPKADYVLIPKDEETYISTKKVDNTDSRTILPRTMEFPPLLRELILRENTSNNDSEPPKLEIRYNFRSKGVKYRIAEEGETPSFEFSMGLGTPVSPELYEGIKLQ